MIINQDIIANPWKGHGGAMLDLATDGWTLWYGPVPEEPMGKPIYDQFLKDGTPWEGPYTGA